MKSNYSYVIYVIFIVFTLGCNNSDDIFGAFSKHHNNIDSILGRQQKILYLKITKDTAVIQLSKKDDETIFNIIELKNGKNIKSISP